MSESIRLTDPLEIEAVKAGEIEGDIYRDGQVWAVISSLLQWRALQRDAIDAADAVISK